MGWTDHYFFRRICGLGGNYECNANGNLTKDRRKGLSFAYNRLNLLEKVWRGDSLLLCYHYLADGTLLDVRDGSGKNGYDYVGSVVYKVTDGKREFDHAVVGDVWFTKDGVRYALTDQLGSVRALIDEEGKVVERHDYYPLGTEQPHEGAEETGNRRLFAGKERQDWPESEVYDFGARMYDAGLGRWLTPDPLSEVDYGHSDYAYCQNNPIRYVDPTGEMQVVYNPDGSYKETRKNTWFHNTFFGLQTYVDYGNGNRVRLSDDEFWQWQYTGSYAMLQPVKAGSAAFFELYLNRPSESWLDVGDKFVGNMLYSAVNSPKVLLTGHTWAGHTATSDERMESFIDVLSGNMSRVASPLLRATDPGAWFKFRNANREMIPTPQRRDMFQGKRRVFENNVKMMETHEHIYKSIDVIKAIKEEKDDVSIR
ncbi:MAG TPA: type IV secretion protein Rhs [Bacteroides sp.]|nr:type IV secretion protein Rhs [Bacteroides sp.]